MDRGFIHVYTGDGKGKTTAALGLAVRAVGAGLRVYIVQFAKGMPYSELTSLRLLGDSIKVVQSGRDCFIVDAPSEKDRRLAFEGLQAARVAMLSGEWDMVVLDEANIAVHFELFGVEDLVSFMDDRPSCLELVITGRRAHERVIERAHLVTEMRQIRHYYDSGVEARIGIES